MYVNVRTPVFLQTARVTVYNPECPNLTADVRLILDNGSQHSCATSSVMEALSLTPSHSETLTIKTFGHHKRKRQSSNVVVLGLKANEAADLHLPLLVVLLICEPLVH